MLKTITGQPPTVLQYALLAVLLTITATLYFPGLQGGFLFDDFYNIVDNPKVHLKHLSVEEIKTAAFSSHAGLLKRPLSMASFALNGYFGGITPGNLKTTNLIIHLFNGVLVFLLTRLTVQCLPGSRQDSYWPLLVTALWLFAPVNLTGVLYAVQRMTSLSALFTFAGLAAYVWQRRRQIDGRCGIGTVAVTLLGFTLLAALAKENGILLPLFALCYELTVLGFKAPAPREKNQLLWCYVLGGILACVGGIFVGLTHPDALFGGYSIRDFNCYERVLTEGRVMWLYLRLIILPTPQLLGMYHDDIAISHSLLSPSSTLWAWSGIAVLLATAIYLRQKQPLFALGILLFFAGQGLESTVLPLEIAHEHRNYFPAYGIYLSSLALLRHFMHDKGYIVATAWVIAFIALTGLRTVVWSDPLELALTDARHHPLSMRSNFEAARQYSLLMEKAQQPELKMDYYRKANALFLKSFELNPSHISGLLGSLSLRYGVNIPPEQQLISLTLDQLRSQIITPETIENLRVFNDCGLVAPCAIPGELIYDLLLAAISNPKTTDGTMHTLMSGATVRALKLQRHQEAFDLAREAAEKYPQNAELRLNFSALLIYFKFYAEAEAELEHIAALELDPETRQKLTRQREELAKLTAQQGHDKNSSAHQPTTGIKQQFDMFY